MDSQHAKPVRTASGTMSVNDVLLIGISGHKVQHLQELGMPKQSV